MLAAARSLKARHSFLSLSFLSNCQSLSSTSLASSLSSLQQNLQIYDRSLPNPEIDSSLFLFFPSEAEKIAITKKKEAFQVEKLTITQNKEAFQVEKSTITQNEEAFQVKKLRKPEGNRSFLWKTRHWSSQTPPCKTEKTSLGVP